LRSVHITVTNQSASHRDELITPQTSEAPYSKATLSVTRRTVWHYRGRTECPTVAGRPSRTRRRTALHTRRYRPISWTRPSTHRPCAAV